MSAATLDEVGLTLNGRIIHHDQDTVYTGYRWLRAVLSTYQAWRSFSENVAKGNTTMESLFDRFEAKNEDLLHDTANALGLGRVIGQQIDRCYIRRKHSTLGNTAPIDYII